MEALNLNSAVLFSILPLLWFMNLQITHKPKTWVNVPFKLYLKLFMATKLAYRYHITFLQTS